jgi:uncharacterized protein (TIRG00374 family)
MKKEVMNWIKLGSKFLFAFAILFYMVKTDRLDLSVVVRGFSQVHLLAICFVLEVLAMLFALNRWKILLRGLDLDYSFSSVLRYGMIGAFFNTTMPGAVSGDIIKAWYIVSDHKGQKKTPVLASILLDRAMGVFGLVLVATSPLLLHWGDVMANDSLKNVAYLILGLFCGVVVFFSYIMLSVWGPLAFLRRKIHFLDAYSPGKIFLQAYDSWISYGHRPWVLVKALLFSVGTHTMIVTVAILCSKALGDNSIELHSYFLLVPIGLLTTVIPIAPAGLGVGHVAFAALFQMAGSNHGAEVFTLLITLQIFINLSGVIFYLKAGKVRATAENLS